MAVPAAGGSAGLVRRLGTRDAVVLGLGSMLGAGVFTAVGPAARAAGSALLVGLVVAAVVALANATSSAQLAAVHPVSGGTYVYGRERLGPWWGYLAGWSFVVGKTASCAAMALTVASYAVPAAWQRPLAVGVVAGVTAVGYRGVTRTAALTRALVVAVLAVLAALVVTSLAGADGGVDARALGDDLASAGVLGVLQSAGLLFFAFAGYARIATMGEEVRDPARTIPRAIVLALSLAVVVYAVVAVTVLAVLGPDGVAASSTPLAAAAEAGAPGAPWVEPLVRAGAVAASLGALLALVAGISRTTLAMARDDELPRWLAAVHPRWHVPHHAETAVGCAVAVLVLVTDLRGAIAFSSFGVLLYYAVANAAALTQPAAERRYPRALAVAGLVGCLMLVATLPVGAVLTGTVVLGLGVVHRLVRRRVRRAGGADAADGRGA
ncbi:transporter [Cellulomonas cellasea DSM 20118]|uniref:Transporter n=3 Tax=Cellulomonas cellasea TaxID=43670 RepID=A0A0A0B4W6_9CELL|nr:transporter [Cellulomonas cellasea DSM 20118]GEA87824.1 amino acid transporter [Cellulomonas cellasea]